MSATEYLDRILRRYAGSFDLKRPYPVGEDEYPAYGYFFRLDEKYVGTRKANLWSVHHFEHALFATVTRADTALFRKMQAVMTDHVEPDLVRKGQKYPEKDHMQSHLTIVMISEESPDEELIRQVRKYRYFRSYLFHFRGHSEGKAVLVDLAAGKVYLNRPAKHLKKLYEDTLEKYEKGDQKIVAFERGKGA